MFIIIKLLVVLWTINEVARDGWCLDLNGLQDHASWRASNLEKAMLSPPSISFVFWQVGK